MANKEVRSTMTYQLDKHGLKGLFKGTCKAAGFTHECHMCKTKTVAGVTISSWEKVPKAME